VAAQEAQGAAALPEAIPIGHRAGITARGRSAVQESRTPRSTFARSEETRLRGCIVADVPALIGAVGTVGTLTTGMVLFANQIADRRRSHASLVAVWADLDMDQGYEWRLHLRNLGKHPIYDCHLDSVLALHIPPGDEPDAQPIDIQSEMKLSFGIVAPGTERTNVSFLKVGTVGPGIDLVSLVNQGLRFRVTFTDTEGRRWIRDERGRLRRVRRDASGIADDR
jgi:hypothetical protein